MSGRRAAKALMDFDIQIYQAVKPNQETQRMTTSEAVEFLKKNVVGTYTLSLVAAAAGVSEEVVIAALVHDYMLVGTTVVCQGIAKNALRK